MRGRDAAASAHMRVCGGPHLTSSGSDTQISGPVTPQHCTAYPRGMCAPSTEAASMDWDSCSCRAVSSWRRRRATLAQAAGSRSVQDWAAPSRWGRRSWCTSPGRRGCLRQWRIPISTQKSSRPACSLARCATLAHLSQSSRSSSRTARAWAAQGCGAAASGRRAAVHRRRSSGRPARTQPEPSSSAARARWGGLPADGLQVHPNGRWSVCAACTGPSARKPTGC